MRITVMFSGLFAVLTGVEQAVLDVAEDTTVEGLSTILEEKYQTLPRERDKTYFMINGQASVPNQILAEGDQVRVFQLLSGG